MTEFRVGDIVRLTKGEPGEPGYRVEVRTVAGGLSKSSEVSLLALRTFENAHWTVEVISRPAPLLPTKPNTLGWATVNGIRRFVRLGASGLWEAYSRGGALASKTYPSAVGDFTEAVLIPKKLADRVTEWAELDAVDGYRLLGDLADHLKGHDDE